MTMSAGTATAAPAPLPMDTLSLPSVARATVQPPLTGPTTSSSGTKTSLKNTSLNSDCPVTMRSGRTSTPSACMSMTMVVMPSCLGASGSVRIVASPKRGVVGAARPDLLAVDQPAAVDPGAPRLDPRRVAAGVGLAEELAPDDLLAQRRQDPARHLVLGRVLDQRQDDPPGDRVLRAGHAGGRELLLDHELLHRAGVAPPRLGPVRHDVPGLDHGVALRRRRPGP